MVPIISIVGNSGSGKTTLLVKLIPELKKRGYKIGTIKHAYHEFDFDKKGKDSWRHKDAGADMVMVSSPKQVAIFKDDTRNSIEDLQHYFHDMDLVIAEGFKHENQPKIEIFRQALHKEPVCVQDEMLAAMVTDIPIDLHVPVFGLDDVKKIADFIEETFL